MKVKSANFTRKVRDESGNIVEQAANAAKAMTRWVAAGLPFVTDEQRAARFAVCGQCEKWDGDARLGLGKCKAKGCGCTSLKASLATEDCPLGKWPAIG